MSKSANSMTHINYKAIKDRMLESTKGFWKVQSIHRLTTRLQNRYNPKDYIILKTIKKPPPKLPAFISFEHEEKCKKRNLENNKNNSCANLKVGNFFITGNERRLYKPSKKEEIKNIFDKLFKNYTYEPFLYNDFQFFYLKKEKRLLPRKFKDVVKDSLAFREYQNYIQSLQKRKDENITTENNMNSTNKNLSFNEQLNHLNIFENQGIKQNNFNHLKPGYKINNKNGILKKHKVYQRKCFSSNNIRSSNIRRNIILKSDVGRNSDVKKYPTLVIKSVYKFKEK